MRSKTDALGVKIVTTLVVACTVLFGAQTIEMTKKQQDDLGVKLQRVTAIDSVVFGPYNGVVVLDKKDIISVSSNVESVVKNIYVTKFQEVKKHQKILTLRSNELLNLQKEYIQALIESKNINETYERNVKLQTEGIISSKKLLLSKKEKQSADLQIKLTRNYLLSSGLNGAMILKIEKSYMPISEINILAPKDGVIYEINANVGEVISSDRSILTLYADGKRFIELSVPVKMVKNISLGDRCEFSDFNAKVTSIGRIVNSQSQSVEVRAEIADAKNIMINRIYSVTLFKKIANSVKIKKSALVYEGTDSFVFKKVDAGFEVVAVEIISEGPTCYIVHAPLEAGDKVAVTSSSALLGGMESEDE